MWRSLDGVDFSAAVGLIAEAYPDVPAARIADDAGAYLAALADADLVCLSGVRECDVGSA